MSFHHHQKEKHNHHHHGHQQIQQYEAPYGAPYDPRIGALDRAYEQKHKRNEHLGEMGALAAGAFALYEHHQVKVDPAHARRHRIEKSVAGAAALGFSAYALHEHHLVQNAHKAEVASKRDKHHRKHHS